MNRQARRFLVPFLSTAFLFLFSGPGCVREQVVLEPREGFTVKAEARLVFTTLLEVLEEEGIPLWYVNPDAYLCTTKWIFLGRYNRFRITASVYPLSGASFVTLFIHEKAFDKEKGTWLVYPRLPEQARPILDALQTRLSGLEQDRTR